MPTLLLFSLLLPLLGLVLIAGLSHERGGMARWITLFVTGLSTLLLVAAAVGPRSAAGLAAEGHLDWVPALGIQLHWGLDPFGWWLSLLLAGLTFWTVVTAWRDPSSTPHRHAWLLAAQAIGGVCLASQDLVLFAVAWLTLPWILAHAVGSEGRAHAATKLLAGLGAGQALFLVAAVVLYLLNGNSSDLVSMAQNHPAGVAPLWMQTLALLALAAGFIFPMALVPFHTWHADAHEHSPVPFSAWMAGALPVIAGYSLFRLGVLIMPGPARDLAPWLLGIAALTVGYGALGAIAYGRTRRGASFGAIALTGGSMLALGSFTLSGFQALLWALPALMAVNPGLQLLAARGRDPDRVDAAGRSLRGPLLGLAVGLLAAGLFPVVASPIVAPYVASVRSLTGW
jgi:NADH-quinone oxidoreductase subunit M